MIEPVWTGLDFSSGPDICVVTIDDGSDAGSWARAIEITPHLAAQLQQITRDPVPPVSTRAGETGGLTPAVPVSPGRSGLIA